MFLKVASTSISTAKENFLKDLHELDNARKGYPGPLAVVVKLSEQLRESVEANLLFS